MPPWPRRSSPAWLTKTRSSSLGAGRCARGGTAPEAAMASYGRIEAAASAIRIAHTPVAVCSGRTDGPGRVRAPIRDEVWLRCSNPRPDSEAGRAKLRQKPADTGFLHPHTKFR